MKTVRFAILGAGGIAAKFAHAVRLTDRAEIVAVGSKSPQRAQAFAAQQGIPAYGDYAAILARGDVDAVYIATTQNFHAENVRMALEHRKHVLCEKAMFLTQREAVELFALAREKGVFIMEAMWSRFLPMIQKAKQWITEGRIGQLQLGNAVIGFDCGGDPQGRHLRAELGGGALYDIGVYAIQLTSYLIGEPLQDVQGFVRRHPVTGVDTIASAVLRFETVDAAIQCCFTGNAKEFILITGDQGYIEIPTAHVGNQAFLYDAQRSLVESFQAEYPEDNGFVYQVEEVVRCIREGRTQSAVMPPEATIEAARIYDRLLR